MRYLFLLMLTVATVLGADATGTWTGTFTPEGDNPGTARLVLVQDGNKLTGTAGPSSEEQMEIREGKAEDGKIKFTVQLNGGILTFRLKQDGDKIAGDIAMKREGEAQTQSAKLAVTRQK